MLSSSCGPDIGRTLSAFPAALPLTVAPWRKGNLMLGQALLENAGSEAVSRPAVKAWGGQNEASSQVNSLSWQDYFSDPAQWWDHRRSKASSRHPDFVHKKSKDALWLNSWDKPAWVDSQLALLDAQLDAARSGPPEFVSTTVQGAPGGHGFHVQVGTCRKLCEEGQVTQAVDALRLLVQRGYHPDTDLLYCMLKMCIARKNLVLGRAVHALSVDSGFQGNAFLATQLICMYASHGSLVEAMAVFSELTPPSAYNWAAIIFAYAGRGKPTHAIELYRQMRESTVKPDNRIFVAVLKACAVAGDLAAGKDVHGHIFASAGKPDIFVQNSLVHMYAKCGSLEDAFRVFDRLPHKDVVTWNAIIAGYAQQGMGQKALGLYSSMQLNGKPPPNSVTFVCVLQACASVGLAALQQGRQIHAQIDRRGLQDDIIVGSSLVNMYAKCGSLEDAQRVFHGLPQKNVVTWTAMITGYAQQGMGQEALSLYKSMQHEGITPPNSVTFVSLLQACACVGVPALEQGKQLHAQMEESGVQSDVFVGVGLVNMYAKCGSVLDARRVFDRLSQKNVITWTAMIAGYAQQGMGQEALSLYSSMQQEGITSPNTVTFVCLLQACAGVGVAAFQQGKQLHAQIEELGVQADVVVGGSLVNMYAKCGSLEDARTMFDRLSQKNVISWNAMISGYAQQGLGQEALALYSGMLQEGITPPDPVTFVHLLQACSSVTALPLGQQLHAHIEERGLDADVAVGCSLVNMYAKCGSLEDAQQVFDSLPERDIAAWGALIAGYARQGDSDAVFQLVDRMRLEGIEQDSITILGVLTVCSHVGLLDKGRKYFGALTTDYGITPTIEHYTCMMDLLGRADHLDEAVEMVKTMPFQPDRAVWLSLLGACRKWSNVEVGRQAFEFAVALDEQDAAAYVLMSDIYADAEMWEDAKQIHSRRVNSGAWKEQGLSWSTDMGGVVHSFVVGDKMALGLT